MQQQCSGMDVKPSSLPVLSQASEADAKRCEDRPHLAGFCAKPSLVKPVDVRGHAPGRSGDAPRASLGALAVAVLSAVAVGFSAQILLVVSCMTAMGLACLSGQCCRACPKTPAGEKISCAELVTLSSLSVDHPFDNDRETQVPDFITPV
eukprot:TRINITY_DN14994_c0_g1_i1.p1 TRINITY_DN14994_c0_g1~~TRINITY_DN14994_c0_g1_i1.p1  ORF type:complete len:150 (-),score=31.02 TRINITY_DN14994_c0_g1_i1:261-710(-)